MSEELRDEMLERSLNEAFQLKESQQYFKALECYVNVLNDTFLKESLIEKHLFLKFNAQKNLGETYELTGNFKLAKEHYTQVSLSHYKTFL